MNADQDRADQTTPLLNNMPGPDLDEAEVEKVARAVHRTWRDSADAAAAEWAEENRRWNYLLDARVALRALKV